MDEPIRTAILTGEGIHDWERSSAMLKSLLERSGRFSVEVSVDPSAVLEERAAQFDLFFVDYHGTAWSDDARQNFLDAVRAGAGVVILHGSSIGFDGWAEYEQICGLVFRKERGSGHGAFHDFEVRVPGEHPVTEGLTTFRTTDEIYHRMIEVHSDYTVLATAFSDPAAGGTGRHEPVMLALSFGGGRVFHCLLGHIWPGGPATAWESEGLSDSLLAGCLWAGSGPK